MLRLLEGEFALWHTAPCLRPADLRSAGMQPRHQRCCACSAGADAVERFVALKRTAPLQVAPLPDAALRLLCLDCFAEAALATGTPLTAAGVEKFVEGTMMGGVEACFQLTGGARMQWGGEGVAGGALY